MLVSTIISVLQASFYVHFYIRVRGLVKMRSSSWDCCMIGTKKHIGTIQSTDNAKQEDSKSTNKTQFGCLCAFLVFIIVGILLFVSEAFLNETLI